MQEGLEIRTEAGFRVTVTPIQRSQLMQLMDKLQVVEQRTKTQIQTQLGTMSSMPPVVSHGTVSTFGFGTMILQVQMMLSPLASMWISHLSLALRLALIQSGSLEVVEPLHLISTTTTLEEKEAAKEHLMYNSIVQCAIATIKVLFTILGVMNTFKLSVL